MKTGLVIFLVGASLAIAVVAVRAQDFGDTATITQFQRAADAYAFTHRQTDRRGTNPAELKEGAMFTPVVAAAFRVRIDAALRAGCSAGAGDQFEVPRVNGPASGAAPMPPCIAAMLPRLPEELEYRISGVVLVLTDAHRLIVVDVLHGAFPRRDN